MRPLNLGWTNLKKGFGKSWRHCSRPSVDAQPFLERAFARRAGLGFVGKNTNLIVPGMGSFLFLANLVVNLDLPSDPVLPQGCGACVHCVDRCPTGALDTPFSLDARLCIAYHTIENRGEIPPEDARPMGGLVVLGVTIAKTSARLTRVPWKADGQSFRRTGGQGPGCPCRKFFVYGRRKPLRRVLPERLFFAPNARV